MEQHSAPFLDRQIRGPANSHPSRSDLPAPQAQQGLREDPAVACMPGTQAEAGTCPLRGPCRPGKRLLAQPARLLVWQPTRGASESEAPSASSIGEARNPFRHLERGRPGIQWDGVPWAGGEVYGAMGASHTV